MQKSAAVKVTVSIVIALVVIGAVLGVVGYFTDGFKSAFRTFFITVNGNQVNKAESSVNVPFDREIRVDVKYVFSTPPQGEKKYSVAVYPNPDAHFDFTVDGKAYGYSSEGELTDCLDIEYEDTFFYIRIDTTMKDILQRRYPDKELYLPAALETVEGLASDSFFVIFVSSWDGSSGYSVTVGIEGAPTWEDGQ